MIRPGLAAFVIAICAGCSNSSPTAPATEPPADFQGQYSGTYRVTKCIDEGIFVGFCDGAGFTAGETLPIALLLTQNQNAASGSVMLGSVSGTFLGTVTGTTLSGTAVMNDVSTEGITLSTAITSWNTTIAGSALTGGFTVVFRTPATTGSATLTNTIARLTR